MFPVETKGQRAGAGSQKGPGGLPSPFVFQLLPIFLRYFSCTRTTRRPPRLLL
jgi:hypothetical protein